MGSAWWILGLLAVVLGSLVFIGHVSRIGAVFDEWSVPPFGDWWNASNTADRLLRGGAIYDARQLSGVYLQPDLTFDGFAYPPAAAVLFIPFRGAEVGLPLWLVVNVGLLVTGLVAIVRSEIPSPAWPAVLVAIGGLLAFPAFAAGVMWANVNVGLAGLFAWCWVDRARWSAFGSGIGAMIKLFPAAQAIWRVRTDGWRSPVRDLVISTLGLIVITLPIVGFDAWTDFVRAMANSRPGCGIPSTFCVVDNFLGVMVARAVTLGAFIMLTLLSLRVTNKAWSYTLLLVAMFIAVPDLHFHYWIYLYVAMTATIANVVARARTRQQSHLGKA